MRGIFNNDTTEKPIGKKKVVGYRLWTMMITRDFNSYLTNLISNQGEIRQLFTKFHFDIQLAYYIK
jgi:hypothetical protein